MLHTPSMSLFESLFLTILLGCSSACFAATVPIPQQVQDLQTAAVTLEKSNDFTGAHAKYKEIVQGYPDTPYGLDACARNARLYIKEKQFKNIEPVVEQMCTGFSDEPGVFGVCHHLVADCMHAKAYTEAIAVCDEVQARLTSSPQLVKVIGWRGMVYARQGDTEKAEQVKQSLLLTKEIKTSYFLDAMSNIGWGYHCAGQWDDALKTYHLGLERDPNHPASVHLQYQIAKAMLAKDDMEGADNEMQTLLANYGQRSQTPGLVFRLGQDYYKKTQWQAAIDVFERLHKDYGDHQLAPSFRDMAVKSHKMLAQRHRRNNQPDLAVSAYEKIIERFPNDEQIPSIRDAIVETYADAGNLTKAQQALQTDIEQCPHRRGLLRMITRVAVDTARAGDQNDAKSQDILYAGDPNTPSTTVPLDTPQKLVYAIFDQKPEGADQQLFGYTTQARVYVHQGKDAEAEATVDKTLELFKDHPDFLSYHLFGVGEEYYLMAQKASQRQESLLANRYYLQAIGMWERQLTKLPECNNGNFMYHLGECCRKTGQVDKALVYYQQLVKRFPTYKKAWCGQYQIGQIYEGYLKEGKVSADEVRQAYQVLLEKYPDCSVAKNASKKLKRYN